MGRLYVKACNNMRQLEGGWLQQGGVWVRRAVRCVHWLPGA